jgi:uncharacterized protein YdiU (UPF0061 family)
VRLHGSYDPATVFSSIDEQGRYAYANQPRIALWNLTRLAECLLPLFSDDQEKGRRGGAGAARRFPGEIHRRLSVRPARKIGLFTARDGDEALVQDLLDAMAQNQADFTLTFRRLATPRAIRKTIARSGEGAGNAGCPMHPQPRVQE